MTIVNATTTRPQLLDISMYPLPLYGYSVLTMLYLRAILNIIETLCPDEVNRWKNT